MSRKRILISSLRRSGSTIFWRCFRDASEALCFDEPFNPNLIRLPSPHRKNVDDEYLQLLDRDARTFWETFSPIYSLDELDPALHPQTAGWLQWLCDRAARVVLDTTRCWNKIDALAEHAGADTYLIHLHRSPAGFTASHLLPSDLDGSLWGKWHLFRRRRSFFDMNGGFNFWNLEDIVGKGAQSAFATRILQDPRLAERFYAWESHLQLLYFWKVAYSKVEDAGAAAFGDRFLSVSFERFSRHPETVLGEIQDATGLSLDARRLPDVRPASPVFQQDDPRWLDAADRVGLPADDEFLFRPPVNGE